jgi:hypothetical protein
MNAFPPGVKEKLLNYVYVYVDPTNDEIFYVGKGKGDRCFSHLSEKKDGDKAQRIKNIRSLKLEPRIDVLAFGLDETSAHRVEAAAIDLVGIKNLTNLQRGHGSDAYGRKTLDDLIALFHAKEIKHFDENVALIRVNRSYRSGMPPAELYEYTRGRWKITEDKRNKVQYACAVYEGVIRETYKVEKWFTAGSTYYAYRLEKLTPKEKGRYEFIGNIADEHIQKKYNYKSVKHMFNPGFAGPILFVGPNFSKNQAQ